VLSGSLPRLETTLFAPSTSPALSLSSATLSAVLGVLPEPPA